MGHTKRKLVLIQLIKSERVKGIFHKKASNFLEMKRIINIKHIEKKRMIKKEDFT